MPGNALEQLREIRDKNRVQIPIRKNRQSSGQDGLAALADTIGMDRWKTRPLHSAATFQPLIASDVMTRFGFADTPIHERQ